MKTEQVMMTPERAKFILSMNTGNRAIRRTSVATFVKKIQRGEWMCTHQGIAVANTGRLLDGQHRLLAIVETGSTVPLLLSTDCEESLFGGIDCGISRSNADLTAIPRKVVEMLTVIGNIVSANRKGITPGEVISLYGMFGAASERVIEVAPSSRRGLSAAPIRAAAAFLLAEGFNEEYSARMYRTLVSLDFESMPRVVQIFAKSLMTSGATGSNAQTVLFCKAMKALDKNEANSAQCYFSDQIREKVFDRVRKFTGPI